MRLFAVLAVTSLLAACTNDYADFRFTPPAEAAEDAGTGSADAAVD